MRLALFGKFLGKLTIALLVCMARLRRGSGLADMMLGFRELVG